MKKRRTLALLMAGILTASALAIGASAEDPDTALSVGIEQQEEATSEKKAKKSCTSTEDAAVKEKKAKKSSDNMSETRTAQKKHGKKALKNAEPEGVIGKDAAKEVALADTGAEAEGHVRGRYTEKDGTGFYKVTFKAGGQKYKYRINAVTGEILDKSVTEITE